MALKRLKDMPPRLRSRVNYYFLRNKLKKCVDEDGYVCCDYDEVFRIKKDKVGRRPKL